MKKLTSRLSIIRLSFLTLYVVALLFSVVGCDQCTTAPPKLDGKIALRVSQNQLVGIHQQEMMAYIGYHATDSSQLCPAPYDNYNLTTTFEGGNGALQFKTYNGTVATVQEVNNNAPTMTYSLGQLIKGGKGNILEACQNEVELPYSFKPEPNTLSMKATFTLAEKDGSESSTLVVTWRSISDLSTAEISVLSTPQIQGLKVDELEKLTQAQIDAFTSEQINHFTEEQSRVLIVKSLQARSKPVIQALVIADETTQNLTTLTATQIGFLTFAQLEEIEKRKDDLTSDQKSVFDSLYKSLQEAKALIETECNSLTEDQLNDILKYESELSDDQKKWLQTRKSVINNEEILKFAQEFDGLEQERIDQERREQEILDKLNALLPGKNCTLSAEEVNVLYKNKNTLSSAQLGYLKELSLIAPEQKGGFDNQFWIVLIKELSPEQIVILEKPAIDRIINQYLGRLDEQKINKLLNRTDLDDNQIQSVITFFLENSKKQIFFQNVNSAGLERIIPAYLNLFAKDQRDALLKNTNLTEEQKKAITDFISTSDDTP